MAKNSTTPVPLNTWLTLGIFAAFVITFIAYVYSEKQIEHEFELRYQSFLLANELRQTSYDLTKMVRTYVVTGDPIYKAYYQDILDILNGKKARPADYHIIYWDLVLADKQAINSGDGTAISLEGLMHQAGFTEREFQILSDAKNHASSVIKAEQEAITLAETQKFSPEAKLAALDLLLNNRYIQAKANMMRPLNKMYRLMDQRTERAVKQAEYQTRIMLTALIGLGLSLFFSVWRTNRLLHATLGGTLREVQTQIARIGSADLSPGITINNSPRSSILGQLEETRQNLYKMRQARLDAEAAKQASDASYRKLFDSAPIGIVTFSSEKLLEGNTILCNLLGYSLEELRELTPSDVVAQAEIQYIDPAIEAIASQPDYAREWQLKRKDGTVFPAEVISTTMPDGTMLSMVRDITARKLADEQLRIADERFRNTFKLIPNPLTLQTMDGVMIDCSDAFCQLIGYSHAEIIGRKTEDMDLWIQPERRKIMRDILQKHGKIDEFEFQLRRRNGEIRTMHISARFMTLKPEPILLAVAQDITERKRAEEALIKKERFIATLAHNMPGLVSHLNRDLRCDFANKNCLNWFGKTAEEMYSAKLQDIIDEDIFCLNELFMYAALEGQAQSFERQVPQPDGSYSYFWVQYLPDMGEDQNVEGVFLVVMDITERKNAELALHEAAQHTQAILDNMIDGVVTINAKGIIESFNKAASTIFGYSPEEVLGANISLLMPAPFKGMHDSYLQHHMETNATHIIGTVREVEGLRKDGSRFPMSLSASKVTHDGRATFVGLVRDITQQRKHEEEIYRLAFYDPLTHLPNRRLLFDRLKQAMITSSRTDQHGALMFLDLDYFKQLNDSLGHDVGDVLLQQVGARLQSCVREGDSVARMGGDEFVMLIEALSVYPNEAAAQAEVIANKILLSLSQPYSLREHTYVITPSIGIVLFLHQTDSMDELLKKADVAMYQAKAAGRNNACFFDPTMQAAAAVRTDLEKSMRRALEQQEFLLHYQLQVNAQGEPTGVEALVRWKHSEHGMISPASFIPLAEETGMILSLGQWVLETACAQLVAWETIPAMANWTMAVNVSVSQFAQQDFVDNVISALEKTKANPHKLKLELTESMLVKDVDDVIVKMNTLKARGVTFSLDDFGTGYSSLSYLKRLPLDQLKIDQSFVRDLLTDPNDAVIANTIIALGHSLGLKVIAEGVETTEQRHVLADMGCDAYQGYYFARPVDEKNLALAMSNIPN